MQRPAQTEAEVRDRLQRIFDRQPYRTEIDGIMLEIAKGVFPADAATSTAMVMQTLREFEPTVALDLCCGCGVMALHMRRLGADVVYACDTSRAAVDCARNNAAANGFNDIRVLQSDLFSNVPSNARVDLVVLNQAYLPGNLNLFGQHVASSRRTVERLFDTMMPYLVPNAAVIIPFSEAAGAANDPAPLARARGYEVEEITFVSHREGNSRVVVIYPNVSLQ